MDEREMMERIRRSAEEIEAPECLKPEQIEDMVQGKEQKRRRLPVYHLGAAAAVLLLVFVLWGQAGYFQKIETGAPEGGTTEAAQTGETEEEKPAERAQKVETEAEEPARQAIDGKTEALPHVASEEELYLALSRMPQMRYTGMEMSAKGMAQDTAAEAEGATESAPSSTEMKEAAGYSETNLQELGVDEGDIVKTDGAYLYVLSDSLLRIIRADGGELEMTSELSLPNAKESIEEMYLDGDTLNLIASGNETSMEEETGKNAEIAEDVYYIDRRSYTKLYTYDISDRKSPRLAGSVRQDGSYRTSRKNGNLVYLFTEYLPVFRENMENSSYLPKVQEAKMTVDDIYLPEYASESAYLVISSVDVEQPDQMLAHKAIVSAAGMFYVSTENIYIAGHRYENGRDYTQLIRFHYQDGEISPAAVGEIEGYLNDSFSMNEYEGYLRVVATNGTGDRELTNLYVLDETLSVCGKIENLAPGENIRSARFFGDAGYFVTFRDMDPLFSADLSDPEHPKLLGELKVTGFSSYLHFYGEDRLLGIGNEVDPETGEYKGVKLSMFDISDPSDVKEISKYVIKEAYDCTALYNYKAIMIDPEKNIFGFACEGNYLVFSYDEKEGFVNEFLYDPKKKERYAYYNDLVRGLYIGQTFYLAGDEGIRSFDMEKGFEETGELLYQ